MAARWVDDVVAAGRGAHTVLITQQDERWSYDRLAAAIRGAAAGFAALGVRRGERVVLVLDDTPAFYAALLGVMRLGAVPVPVNFLSRAEDLAFFLDDAYAVACVVDAVFLPKIDPVLAERPHVHKVVANSGDFDGWMAAEAQVPLVPVHADDPALWLYSSGSTGRPKGVVHRYASIEASVAHYAKGVLGIGPDDVCYSSTPLFHAYGLGNSLWFPLAVGATVVLSTGRPTAERLLERVRRHAPTLYFSVPALYAALLNTTETDGVDWSCVRLGVSAAECLPGEVGRQFRMRTGVEVLDGIGSTEMLHIYCSNRPGSVAWDTSGTPVEGYELAIDERTGELRVRGPSMLLHYHHQTQRTRAKLEGHWFATGDRYRRDGKHFVYEGRVDDLMKVGGLWVSPIDIEKRLIEHPAVSEAAVVGVTVEHRSRICAHVILAPEHAGDEALVAALQAWCKDGLLRYQYPHLVRFVDDFPRTATGKVQRFRIRALESGN